MKIDAQIFRALFAALVMGLAGLSSAVLEPRTGEIAEAPDLDALLPEIVGPWQRIALSSAVLPNETTLGPGEAVAYRAYRDDLGRVVTLVAAYGPPLGDSVRLHRPEACYVAQGYLIEQRDRSNLVATKHEIPVVHLDTRSPERNEAVTYWLRDGDSFTTSSKETQFIRGLSAPLDGALIRVSTQSGAEPYFNLHKEFLADFADALSAEGQALFITGGA